MRCIGLYTKRKYNPQGGSNHLTSSTQGSLLSSATLGYQKYNPGGVASTPTIDHQAIMRRLRTTWHLSLRHNMGCGHTIPMGCGTPSAVITEWNDDCRCTIGDSVARRGSRLRVAFACIVGENPVKEKWTIDDFRHP